MITSTAPPAAVTATPVLVLGIVGMIVRGVLAERRRREQERIRLRERAEDRADRRAVIELAHRQTTPTPTP